MNRVRLKITPALASIFNASAADWVILEKEVSEGTTVSGLLAGLAASYHDFRKVVLDPDTGEVGEQVNIVLNDTLLQPPDMAGTKLNDGDTVIFLPVYSGG